jgi:hypothetical protein
MIEHNDRATRGELGGIEIVFGQIDDGGLAHIDVDQRL